MNAPHIAQKEDNPFACEWWSLGVEVLIHFLPLLCFLDGGGKRGHFSRTMLRGKEPHFRKGAKSWWSPQWAHSLELISHGLLTAGSSLSTFLLGQVFPPGESLYPSCPPVSSACISSCYFQLLTPTGSRT